MCILGSTHSLRADNNSTIAPVMTVTHDNNNSPEILAIVGNTQILKSSFDSSFKKSSRDKQITWLNKVIDSELLVQYASKLPLYSDKNFSQTVRANAIKGLPNTNKINERDFRMILGLETLKKIAEDNATVQINDTKIAKYYKDRERGYKNMEFFEGYIFEFPTKDKAIEMLKLVKNQKEHNKTIVMLASKYNAKKEKIYKYGIANNSLYRDIFSLKTDMYSKKPIFMDGDYYIVYCENKGLNKSVPTLNELHDNIRDLIIYKSNGKWMGEKLSELKNHTKIINYLENNSSL